MIIRLHHLNQSRSLRILWLLEELNVPYELIPYQRDAMTYAAPPELKHIHPLGKSPVIEINDQVVAESGAITSLLVERFAADRLRPDINSIEYAEYLQWIEFAESSLMVPMLLDIFTHKAGVSDNPFLSSYIAQEKGNLLSYLNHSLADKTYIVGNKLSGADFMLAFDLIMLDKRKQLDNYPHIKQYVQHLEQLPSFQRAMQLETQNDSSHQ